MYNAKVENLKKLELNENRVRITITYHFSLYFILHLFTMFIISVQGLYFSLLALDNIV